MKGDKVIRDSVHGNIVLPKAFVDKIIDTPQFQRLRRIEQTSIRAIYPCARHDRFTHSLGVYHVGTMIVEQLRNQLILLNLLTEHEINEITQSYLIACLLHDIAHAPFSHTFEEYYGYREVLYDKLCEELHIDFNWSVKRKEDTKEHEYASAIVAATLFKTAIESHELKGNVELVCRMIIGAEYKNKDKFYQICDCFIKLLHGNIDADRLDYASRDIWASGYKTISVDIKRIIRSMCITKHNKVYQLCFNYHAVRDIYNIIELKWFQSTHIFNHHTIVYDQSILVQAAEQMAKSLFPEMEPEQALSEIICIEAVCGEKDFSDRINNCHLRYLCDDDLFYLMKQNNNPYFKEWSSRKYSHFALWKSPEEFYNLFPEVSKKITLNHPQLYEKVSMALAGIIDTSKILIVDDVEYKAKADLNELLIIVNEGVKKYEDVCHEIFKNVPQKKSFVFSYLYLPKPENIDDMEELRETIIQHLRPIMNGLFQPQLEGSQQDNNQQ